MYVIDVFWRFAGLMTILHVVGGQIKHRLLIGTVCTLVEQLFVRA